MCGIVGIYHYRSSGEVDASALTAMRDTMVHRGPDGAGNWISPDRKVGLGHRRLSIVDLSQNALQPMANEDHTVWITFNGEIYNHQTLREQLIAAGHHFRTHTSDTETLVHGYEQWGMEGLLERISGDFAIGIWDANSRTLSMARDRVGVKPLYFSFNNGVLLFASEIKAILAHGTVQPDIDPCAMYHYLSFLTTPAPMTMFSGIYKLPAGFVIQVKEEGKLRARRYWDAAPGNGIPEEEIRKVPESCLEEYYIQGIRDRLRDAIKERMMSDVPFGVFLSGGVDSSTNVALMAELMDRPVETFTVGFKDHTYLNELEYAKLIANKFKTNHHEILIDEKDMVSYLEKLILHQDEPLADWVCVPLYFVSKLAKDSGVTVIQVGEGSDEQFCGYKSYMGYLQLYSKCWQPFQKYLPKPAQRTFASLFTAAASMLPHLSTYADIVDRAAGDREVFWSGAMSFGENLKGDLVNRAAIEPSTVPEELIESGMLPASYLKPDTFNVVRSFLDYFDNCHPGQDVLGRMVYNEFKLRLPELLLMRVDKVAMSVSLEARVPFLAHKVVEFSSDIPMASKVSGGEPKYLLKKAVEGLIPNEIIYRKKMGFGAPMSQWLKGGFGKQAEGVVLGSGLMRRGYFNREYIRNMFRDHRGGRADRSLHIWTLFNLCAWYDFWVEPKRSVATA